MVMEEKKIHMLKQYSHIYLPYTPWIISETQEFEKKQRERAEWREHNFSGGKK